MKFKSDIEVQAGLKDSSGSNGTTGQILSSNGTTVSWVPPGASFASDVQNEVKAGVAIGKGQAVYVTSANGTNIIVGLASNTLEATSSKTLGLLDATVAANGFANVIQIGRLEGLNTSAATIGDPVWLGTGGNLIYGLANKPYAPAHLVYIGVVTRVNTNNGEIFISVQNGFELKEIHDVDLVSTAPTNNDILAFEGGSVNLWKNKTIPAVLGYIPADDANVVHKTGDESIAGFKTFTNNIYTNSTGSANVIEIQRSGSFRGRISTESDGFGLYATAVGAAQRYGLRFDYGDSNFVATYAGDPNSPKFYVSSSSTVTSNSFYAPIYYDNNNTAYYLDPASTSNLYGLTVNQSISGSVTGSASNLSGSINFATSGISSMKVNDTRYWVTDPNAPGNYFQALTMGNGSDFTQIGVNSSQEMYFRFNGSGNIWNTVLSSNNYSSFAVPLSRTITINGVTQDLSANRSWTVTAVETDTLATVTARGNTTGDKILSTYNSSSGIANNSFNTTKTVLGNIQMNNGGGVSGNNNQAAITFQGSNINEAQAGIYVSNNGSTGTAMGFATTDSYATGPQLFLYGLNDGTTIFPRSYSQANGSFRAPVFYDSNDTTYYTDLASTSQNATRQRGGTVYGPNTTWGAYLLVGGNGRTSYIDNALTASVCATDGNIHIDAGSAKSTYFNWYDGSSIIFGNGAEAQIGTMNSSGDLTVNSSSRAPIFYDSNNTGYYLDPASTSNINAITIGSASTVYNGLSIVRSGGGSDPYGVLGVSCPSGDNYSYIGMTRNGVIGLGMGIDTSNNFWIGGTGGGFNAVRTSTNILINSGGVQSPVFYDLNNTGYYVDPSSTSYMNIIQAANRVFAGWDSGQSGSISCNNWFRTNGTTGWYNESYAGGWYMVDSSWVRSYNDKGVYTGGIMQSADSHRAPVFYDLNDTGYYLDPASTSNIRNITVNSTSATIGLTVNHSNSNGVAGSKFVGATGNSYGAITTQIDISNYGTGIKITNQNSTYANSAMQFFWNTTQVGGISINTTSTTYATSSDYRLKENVTPMTSSVERLKELSPCRFNFISDPSKIVDGFIAHEVQEVIPEAVTGVKDELDYDGSPKYQGIDQSKIVPLLTSALQEAILKIEELENRLSILENK